jgi:negative regulator of flagellin synthesis FlgM
MRIEAYNQVAQIYGANKVHKSLNKEKVNSMGRDEVRIQSTFGKDLEVAKNAVKEAPDVRSDKVNDIKSRIDAGTYSVDTGDFAALLLSKLEER